MEYIFEKISVPNKHSFFSRKAPLGTNERIHSHKNYELNYIGSGTGRRIVGDHISGFEKGDLVLMGPNVPHCWEVLDEEKGEKPFCVVTHFSEDITGAILNSEFFKIPEMEGILNLLKLANRGLRFKVKEDSEIIKHILSLTELSGLEYYILLLKIFHLLSKIEDKERLSNPLNEKILFTKNLKKINKVYEYVFQNIQEGVKLDDAASVVNMAPSSFCRYFKKQTNVTFMDYVKSVRVGIASKLLAETDKQITQICFESGYNNLANFNHYFKKSMDKTPSQYRKSFM